MLVLRLANGNNCDVDAWIIMTKVEGIGWLVGLSEAVADRMNIKKGQIIENKKVR